MSKKQPFVSIIVVNFNGKKLTKKCLDSLFKIDYPGNRFEIIVVDNYSQDDSVKFIKHKYKKVRVIENRQNNYCQACNLGILESRGSYVVLLNNDVVVKKGWLSELVKPIEKDRSIGAVSSMLLEKSGLIQNAGLYELPNFYWDERGAGKKPKEFNYVTDLEAVCGASVLYRKSALQGVGLFDEDFLMFGEDVDMSIRFRKKGWRLIFAPSSVAYHKKHGSCNEEFSREAIEKNRLLFIAKHYPDKLAKSLIGNSYFIANKDNLNSGRFFDLVAQVFLRLLKEHGQSISNGIIKDLFEELKNITNYENKKMEMELKNLLDDLMGTKKDRDWLKMQEEKHQKDTELDKDRISSLSSDLHDKENIIQEKEHKIKQLSESNGIMERNSICLRSNPQHQIAPLSEVESDRARQQRRERGDHPPGQAPRHQGNGRGHAAPPDPDR
jgi:GT2 family glycosyltransferase